MRRLGFILMLAACLTGVPQAAWGHAERADARPEPGDRLGSVPVAVSVDYTEPPAADPSFQVLDGCGRDVVTSLKVQNLTIEAQVGDGQPGEWIVRSHVVSGIDGHATRDSFSFVVRGKPDCDENAGGVPAPREDESDGGPGAGFLLPVAGVAVVVLAAALLLRRSG